LGFCKLLPEAFVMLLVDQVGRRPLLISSSSGVTVFIFMLSASFAANGSGGLTVALLCFYMVIEKYYFHRLQLAFHLNFARYDNDTDKSFSLFSIFTVV